MRLALGRRGLRARIVPAFAAGTLLVSAVLVGTTYLLARNYLVDQREQALTQQAFADASVLSNRLSTAGTDIGLVLGELVPSNDADVVVRSAGAWYSSSLDVGGRDVPADLQDVVASGAAGAARIDTADGPRLVVAVPVVAADVEFYEICAASTSWTWCCGRWRRPGGRRAGGHGGRRRLRGVGQPARRPAAGTGRQPPRRGSPGASCRPACRPATTPT